MTSAWKESEGGLEVCYVFANSIVLKKYVVQFLRTRCVCVYVRGREVRKLVIFCESHKYDA